MLKKLFSKLSSKLQPQPPKLTASKLNKTFSPSSQQSSSFSSHSTSSPPSSITLSLHKKCLSLSSTPPFTSSTFFTTHLPFILQAQGILQIMESKMKVRGTVGQGKKQAENLGMGKGIGKKEKIGRAGKITSGEGQLSMILAKVVVDILDGGVFCMICQLWVEQFFLFQVQKIANEKDKSIGYISLKKKRSSMKEQIKLIQQKQIQQKKEQQTQYQKSDKVTKNSINQFNNEDPPIAITQIPNTQKQPNPDHNHNTNSPPCKKQQKQKQKQPPQTQTQTKTQTQTQTKTQNQTQTTTNINIKITTSATIQQFFQLNFSLLIYFLHQLVLHLYGKHLASCSTFDKHQLWKLIRDTVTGVACWRKVHAVFRQYVHVQHIVQFTKQQISQNISQLQKLCKISQIPIKFLSSTQLLHNFVSQPELTKKLALCSQLPTSIKQQISQYRQMCSMPPHIYCADDILSALTFVMWGLKKNVYGCCRYVENVLCCELDININVGGNDTGMGSAQWEGKLADELEKFGEGVRHAFDTVRSVGRIGAVGDQVVYGL